MRVRDALKEFDEPVRPLPDRENEHERKADERKDGLDWIGQL